MYKSKIHQARNNNNVQETLEEIIKESRKESNKKKYQDINRNLFGDKVGKELIEKGIYRLEDMGINGDEEYKDENEDILSQVAFQIVIEEDDKHRNQKNNTNNIKNTTNPKITNNQQNNTGEIKKRRTPYKR